MNQRLQLQPLSDDRHEHIRAQGTLALALHGILRGAEERLDPQVLLDSFEENLSGKDRCGIRDDPRSGSSPSP